MNMSYDYYLLTRYVDTYPAWIKSERYFNCEHFSSRILGFFKKEK